MRKELKDILNSAREFKHTNDIMFIIARNTNKNIVCFEGDDEIGCKDPYWIMYEHSPVDMESLTHLERKFGFGLNTIESDTNFWKKSLVALKSRPIVFTKKEGIWKAYTKINGNIDEIESIYIHNTKGLGIFPKVDYIYVYGKNEKEKIINNK